MYAEAIKHRQNRIDMLLANLPEGMTVEDREREIAVLQEQIDNLNTPDEELDRRWREMV
jgi:hypothetical protein